MLRGANEDELKNLKITGQTRRQGIGTSGRFVATLLIGFLPSFKASVYPYRNPKPKTLNAETGGFCIRSMMWGGEAKGP